MHILQLTVRFPPAPGGVETHVLELAAGLRRRGHEVRVVTSDLRKEIPFERLPPSDPQWSSVQGVPVQRLRALTLGGEAHYVMLRSLLPTLLRAAPGLDLLHVHVYGMSYLAHAAVLGKLRGLPVIFTPHYHPPWSMAGGQRRAGLRRLYDRLFGPAVLRGMDIVIVNSAQEGAALGALGVPPRRLLTLTSGIDPSAFDPTPPGAPFRAALGIASDAPLVLYAGRLASNKGLSTLVQATAALVPTFPTLVVALVGGDFGVQGQLRAQVEAAGLQDHVLFTGHLDDQALYRSAHGAADVFVLPSEYEAFGIVLAEAMAAGKPTVATDRGGMPELVVGGTTGLLVPYKDHRALAAALAQLLSDPQRAAAMGAAGRDRVRSRYSWDAVLDRLEKVYSDAVDAGAGTEEAP